jgi:signal recognition particle receptor subunit beta
MLEYFRARRRVPTVIAANKTSAFAADRERIVADLAPADEAVVPTNALDFGAVKQTLVEVLELAVAAVP